LKKLSLGVIGLFLIVIMASGCTDSGNSTGNTTNKASLTDQIVTDNTPVVTQMDDGSGTMIGGLIKNTASTDVKNVQIMVIGLDVNGNKIAEKKVLIAHIKADDDASYDVTLPENSKIVAGDVKVLNATTVWIANPINYMAITEYIMKYNAY